MSNTGTVIVHDRFHPGFVSFGYLLLGISLLLGLAMHAMLERIAGQWDLQNVLVMLHAAILAVLGFFFGIRMLLEPRLCVAIDVQTMSLHIQSGPGPIWFRKRVQLSKRPIIELKIHGSRLVAYLDDTEIPTLRTLNADGRYGIPLRMALRCARALHTDMTLNGRPVSLLDVENATGSYWLETCRLKSIPDVNLKHKRDFTSLSHGRNTGRFALALIIPNFICMFILAPLIIQLGILARAEIQTALRFNKTPQFDQRVQHQAIEVPNRNRPPTEAPGHRTYIAATAAIVLGSLQLSGLAALIVYGWTDSFIP
ncbi:MAG: hypothetical protein KDK34_03305 [Leptospiraceae bacterium]|nr:hypothetical protein [Leptospiraceae bacterium]